MNKEIRFIKDDGNAWIAVLPDFENLQVSPAFPIDPRCDMHQILEDVNETLMSEKGGQDEIDN